MSKLRLIPALVLTLLLVIGGSMANTAQAKIWKNLEIHNKTGYEIKALYLVPYGSSHFGEEQINARGYSSFPNNTYLPLSYNAEHSKWWLKIVFMNGATREWSGNNTVDLSGAYKITISSIGQDKNGRENFRWQKN